MSCLTRRFSKGPSTSGSEGVDENSGRGICFSIAAFFPTHLSIASVFCIHKNWALRVSKCFFFWGSRLCSTPFLLVVVMILVNTDFFSIHHEIEHFCVVFCSVLIVFLPLALCVYIFGNPTPLYTYIYTTFWWCIWLEWSKGPAGLYWCNLCVSRPTGTWIAGLGSLFS